MYGVCFANCFSWPGNLTAEDDEKSWHEIVWPENLACARVACNHVACVWSQLYEVYHFVLGLPACLGPARP